MSGEAIFPRRLSVRDTLDLLLGLDFNEVEEPAGIAKDASMWKFFVNAVYEGGVNISICGVADIDKALPIIRQAWELAKT